MPNFSYEIRIQGYVAGIDEVGRGPLAGPVIACAAVLPRKGLPRGIQDSKQLTASERLRLRDRLEQLRDKQQCWFAVAEASVEEIDRQNILRASQLAMRRAFDCLQALLPEPAVHALIDGNRPPEMPVPSTALIKGDSLSLSIAAASILAKTHRDAQMARLAADHPGYGWERNAGYGTAEHLDGMKRHGVTPHHRRSFAPVRVLLEAL